MIKILACIFMLIDHVGYVFFPDIITLRLIGRLSMPLYAYCIARGIQYTHDKKQYLFRLFGIAVTSQIPYMLMVRKFKLNVCFLWAGAVVLIWGYKAIKSNLRRFLFTSGIILAFVIIPVDYGLYGLLYVIISHFSSKKSDTSMYCLWLGLHALYMILDLPGGIIQLFTLPTIPIIDICNKFFTEKPKKNILITWFYPIHMMVLLMIQIIMH